MGGLTPLHGIVRDVHVCMDVRSTRVSAVCVCVHGRTSVSASVSSYVHVHVSVYACVYVSCRVHVRGHARGRVSTCVYAREYASVT